MARLVTISSVLAGLLLLVPVALAEDKKLETPKDDNDFLIKSISCGTAEVQASELAAKQAATDKVKDFANRMVKDHKQLNNELLTHAKGLKVAVVTGLEKDQRQRYDSLSKLKGNEFDREYMSWMTEAH